MLVHVLFRTKLDLKAVWFKACVLNHSNTIPGSASLTRDPSGIPPIETLAPIMHEICNMKLNASDECELPSD